MKKDAVSITNDKDLIKQWDWKSNNKIKLDPKIISNGSHKKAFWCCEKHDTVYSQIIRARKKGKLGCERCKQEQLNKIERERFIKGKEVLADTNPDLVKEWIKSDNDKFTPYNCLPSSNVKVTWKCPKCGGEYQAYIYNRTRMKSGCPYCAGQKVLEGFNDLETKNPHLALEWSPKNKVSPKEVTEKSNKKVYWICKLGHNDYLSSVKQRSMGQGCPVCALQSQTSFPEQAILYYVKKLFGDATGRYKYEKYEIDIFIPSKKIGIEYNGVYYHRNKKKYDSLKRDKLSKAGIRLITVEESDDKDCVLDTNNNYDYYNIHWNYDDNHLSLLIRTILDSIYPQNGIEINVKKDRIHIYEQYINSVKENSIAIYKPQLLKEWDYKMNGKILPEYVTYGSQKKYYWICSKCNYSYLASPRNRMRGSGCPCCAGKIVVKGINDLRTKFPEIAKEWCYEKNNGLKPEDYSFGSRENVWWKCSAGHIWRRTINGRTNKNNGCPYCSGRVAIKGVNDLESTCPELLKDWDFVRNTIQPKELKKGSNIKVWWKCQNCGHEWKTSVNDRSSKKGCPKCHNKYWKE